MGKRNEEGKRQTQKMMNLCGKKDMDETLWSSSGQVVKLSCCHLILPLLLLIVEEERNIFLNLNLN